MCLWLVACKAESLGVDVPRGGPDAVSQEDLQRDLWLLTEPALGGSRAPGSPGGSEAVARVQRRFEEMHLLPAFGESYVQPGGAGVLCGLKDGRSGKALLVAAEDPGSGAAAAAAVAALISLAKALDVPAPPEHTWALCVWPAQSGAAAYAAQPAFPLDQTRAVALLGPLGGAALAEAPGPALGTLPTTLWTAGPVPEAASDTMDRLDYRLLAQHVREIYGRLNNGG